MELKSKLKVFYITSIFSMVFAVLGFSYNTWRMELSEDNSNIRTAAFEVLLQLSELEQVIYSAHYDKNAEEGSPRKGWVKVGLVDELSVLIGPQIKIETAKLKLIWSERWQDVASSEDVVTELVAQIDKVRGSIKVALKNLQ